MEVKIFKFYIYGLKLYVYIFMSCWGHFFSVIYPEHTYLWTLNNNLFFELSGNWNGSLLLKHISLLKWLTFNEIFFVISPISLIALIAGSSIILLKASSFVEFVALNHHSLGNRLNLYLLSISKIKCWYPSF